MNTKRIEKALEALKSNKAVFMKAKTIDVALRAGKLEHADKFIAAFYTKFVEIAFINELYMDIYEEIGEFYNAAIAALIEEQAAA